MLSIVNYRVAWSVGQSVTLVSPAKMAVPLETLFGLSTRVGPGNHVLDAGPDPPWDGAIFSGKVASRWPRAGSGAVSKWVICACDSLVDFGAV